MKKQTGTAFNGAAGLQKNVDFPVKLQDKVRYGHCLNAAVAKA